MSNIVFDSSVLLAILQGERVDVALPQIRWASMSAVNVAEVWTKLAVGSDDARNAGAYLIESLREVTAFDREQARLAGELQLQAHGSGLSLGGRACLALALLTGAEIYTADRIWARLNLPCTIHLQR